MEVAYMDHSGDDLTVVNAARVSFDKVANAKTWYYVEPGLVGDVEIPELKKADIKLINYLADHGHWTPFAHCTLTLKIKAPIFVARQLFKHKVGMIENEISRRYVDNLPEFYTPEEWRAAPEGSRKQGSGSEVIILEGNYANRQYDGYLNEYDRIINEAVLVYNNMLKQGVAPEQARMVLPQSMYTEWYWTGSLAAYSRIYKLRNSPDAQQESRNIVKDIGDICEVLFPNAWKALNKKQINWKEKYDELLSEIQ